jgi:3,4-dihydroxyphenylacetate 2,3-dioxygenase
VRTIRFHHAVANTETGTADLPQTLKSHRPRKEAIIMAKLHDSDKQSAGFWVTEEAPIVSDNPIKHATSEAPDILRCAYMELIVTDLAASREFYVDVLGLYVTTEDDEAIYLRSTEEFIHHNLVLRKGPVAAVAAFSYRVRTPGDLDKAVAFFEELGCEVRRNPNGFVKGIGDSVRVVDPLGFPYEFFYQTEHTERMSWRYDLHIPGELVRLDHFNQLTPDVPRAVGYMQNLGFRVTEDIQDHEGTVYAAWMRRKPTVHDTAMTGGDGPRMHHVCFATHEKHNILAICDKLGSLRKSDSIERGPGRHGVSNAFYLYLRDPDGHRVEVYTQDYYTGDPDNPVVTWDVHDNQRRDWWGNPVVPSWYTDGSLVLDLDGNPQPVVARTDDSEMAVTIGADGFSYTREGDDVKGFKLGETL